MPDIAMCLDKKCPSRELCYRFIAVANASGWQSYGSFNHDADTGKCKNFIQTTKSDKTKNL